MPELKSLLQHRRFSRNILIEMCVLAVLIAALIARQSGFCQQRLFPGSTDPHRYRALNSAIISLFCTGRAANHLAVVQLCRRGECHPGNRQPRAGTLLLVWRCRKIASLPGAENGNSFLTMACPSITAFWHQPGGIGEHPQQLPKFINNILILERRVRHYCGASGSRW